MVIGRFMTILMVSGCCLAVFAAGTAFTQASQTALIKVDGSSTVFPITEAVAEEFQKETRGAVRVTVGISGTGGGFKKFCRGEIDVQDASPAYFQQRNGGLPSRRGAIC